MAGDWIKFEVATSDKPEVWEIATALNIDPDAVVGKLLRVWSWFDAHTENGNAKSVSKLLLDRSVGVIGFCDAVLKCGWMLDVDGVLSLPNFNRHNGKTAKNRILTAKRVANHKAKTNDDGNDDSVSDALAKEEKRRLKELAAKAAKPKSSKTTLKTYLDQRKAENLPPFNPGSKTSTYAEDVGMPEEFAQMAWRWFKHKYTEGDSATKKQSNWASTFLNSLKGCWCKFWWLNGTTYELTTVGKQAQIEYRNAA